MTNPEHILLAVLDWGLGHAGRCVPLIRRWRAEGKHVTVATAGDALAFLRASGVGADFLALPPYAVRYPTTSMVWNLAWQSPRLGRVMRAERRMIAAYVAEHPVDRIVSDGRFGCRHPQVESVWLAHQLHLHHPFSPLARAAKAAYHAFLRRYFDGIWVPDFAGDSSLAGTLARPVAGMPHEYLGPLSRFAARPPAISATPAYKYLALLSGPEPQRTYLEDRLTAWLRERAVPALIVRGVRGDSTLRRVTPHLLRVDWLLGDDLYAAVAASERIICRSGYSTLMDTYYWRKPLLLIPTPGQTEQEYLAAYWVRKGWAERFDEHTCFANFSSQEE